MIDFVAVLPGYAISGERTLEAFYQHAQPFAHAFMVLFGREHLPARSMLARVLAELTPQPVEALRTLFTRSSHFLQQSQVMSAPSPLVRHDANSSVICGGMRCSGCMLRPNPASRQTPCTTCSPPEAALPKSAKLEVY